MQKINLFLCPKILINIKLQGKIKIPIFYGGLNWSNIRKAQEINSRDKYLLLMEKEK